MKSIITASTIDCSFSGTQNVEAEYGSADDRIAITSSGSGLSYSVGATYTDPAGHHVTDWVVSWGDGTIQSYTSSDSSTDGTDTDPTSTDTKSFTHTFADTPSYDYDVTITAVTDENVYQAGTVAAVSTDLSWSSDTLSATTQSTDTETYPTPIDGISDAEATISGATPGTFTVNWGDTTDGSDDTTFYSADSTVISPAHTYAQAGTYVVTITETPDGGGPTLTGHAFMPVAAGTPTMPAINDQVLAAGAVLGITDGVTAASGDPLFATIKFDNGTAPRVVPISDGAIDLTAVDAPSNFVGDQASDGVSTAVDAYNAAAQGVMGQQSFLTDAWSVVIDHGESNDLLLASFDGTDNQQDVTLYFPHPAGEALTLNLSSTDASQNYLFDSGTKIVPSGSDYPSVDIASDDSASSITYEDGAIEGNSTAGVLEYTLSGEYDASDSTTTFQSQAAAGCGTVPATEPTSKPVSQAGVAIQLVLNPNSGVTNANVTGSEQPWLVGQDVALKAVVTSPPGVPGYPAYKLAYSWDVGGNVLHDYSESAKGANAVHLSTATGIESGEIEFFWVSASDSPETEGVALTVSQWGMLMAHPVQFQVLTSFTVEEPEWTMDVPSPGSVTGGTDDGRPYVYLDMAIAGSVSIPGGFGGSPGEWKFLQLGAGMIGTEYGLPGVPDGPVDRTIFMTESGGEGYDLDGPDVYPYMIGNKTLDDPIETGTAETMVDEPGDFLNVAGSPLVVLWNTRNSHWETYLMFRPPGGSWVPVASVDWRLGFTVVIESQLSDTPAWRVKGAVGPDASDPAPTVTEPFWNEDIDDVKYEPWF